MKVTVIGSGNMARGIANRLLAGGHGITILGHHAGDAEALAGELNGSVDTGVAGDSIEDAEVFVLATPYEAADSILGQYGDALSGKAIVDISNPVDWQTFDGLVTPADSSASEEIAKSVPDGAHLVKAWNTVFAGTLSGGQVAGHPLDVFVAGDDAESKETVISLIKSDGSNALDAGPLRRARELERLGFFGITLQQPLGLNFQSAWKLIS